MEYTACHVGLAHGVFIDCFELINLSMFFFSQLRIINTPIEDLAFPSLTEEPFLDGSETPGDSSSVGPATLSEGQTTPFFDEEDDPYDADWVEQRGTLLSAISRSRQTGGDTSVATNTRASSTTLSFDFVIVSHL